MLSCSNHTPPLILYLQTPDVSALETLTLIQTQRVLDTTQSLAVIQNHASPQTDLQSYFFGQYVILLYLTILARRQTTPIYTQILQRTRAALAAADQARQIQDPLLCELIRTLPFEGEGVSTVRARTLEILLVRLRPESCFPDIAHLVHLVSAIYDERPRLIEKCWLYKAVLAELDDQTPPTLALIPYGHQISLTTAGVEQTKDLLWKLIFSISFPLTITGPDRVAYLLETIAALALPLEPVALTQEMTFNLQAAKKLGIPFVNFLAMYLRQNRLGFDYTLSRLANPRRMLLQNLHRFCGVGAMTISDRAEAGVWIRRLYEIVDTAIDAGVIDRDALENRMIIALTRAIESSETVRLTNPLRNEGSVEAGGVTRPVKPSKKTSRSISPSTSQDPQTPGPPEETAPDDDAFADDPAETTNENPDEPATDPTIDPTQNDNDTIDRTGDVGRTPAADTANAFIPLALPTENIDDHLIRLVVLNYVTSADTASNPTLKPEDLTALKYWCEKWLFIASIDLTKKLLSRLHLTGLIKEFTG